MVISYICLYLKNDQLQLVLKLKLFVADIEHLMGVLCVLAL